MTLLQSFLLSILPPALLLPPMLIALVLGPLSFNAVNVLPAGPTPLIFALLAQYHAAIPTVYKYRLGTTSQPSSNGASNHHESPSILLSDKSIHYLLTAQLALSSLPGSLLAAAVGWGLGVAWRAELGPEGWARWRLPDWLSGRRKQEAEGFDALRRRLEGEGQGGSVENEETEGARRRTLGRGILDQFRGAF